MKEKVAGEGVKTSCLRISDGLGPNEVTSLPGNDRLIKHANETKP
jgi:hypothetical protein